MARLSEKELLLEAVKSFLIGKNSFKLSMTANTPIKLKDVEMLFMEGDLTNKTKFDFQGNKQRNKNVNTMKLIFWGIIFFLIYYAYDQGLLDDFISDFETGFTIGSKNISELSCKEDIKKLATGKELKNAFGLTFSIIKVKNIKEISKSEKSITCIGDAMFDNAKESKLLMKVF